jgi:hypothetical protein
VEVSLIKMRWSCSCAQAYHNHVLHCIQALTLFLLCRSKVGQLPLQLQHGQAVIDTSRGVRVRLELKALRQKQA